jgi:hypothetical protein
MRRVHIKNKGVFMSHHRRRLLGAGLLGSVLMQSGCMPTQAVPNAETRTSTETLAHVLVSGDGQKLVLVSGDHHDIFDAPQTLVHSLGTTLYRDMEGSLGTLEVDRLGAAQITYRLITKGDIAARDRQAAVIAGFAALPGTQALKADGVMRGTRYRTNGRLLPPLAVLLNRSYRVKPVAEFSDSKSEVRLLLTPITAAADGLWLLGDIALLPVTRPEMLSLLLPQP